MQNDRSHPITRLQASLLPLPPRRRAGRTVAGISTLVVLAGLTLWAQSSTGPITLQSLSQRIDTLEKRLAKDEASNSRTASPPGGPAKSGAYTGGTDVDAAVQKLTAQVAELEQEVAQYRSAASTVKAPFRIVGAGGQTLLSVTEGAPGSGKLEMKGASGKAFTVGITDQGDAFGRWDASNGSAYVGSPSGKYFGVRLYAAGGNKTMVAMSESDHGATVAVGLNGASKVEMNVDNTGARVGVLDDSGQKYLSNLTTHGSNGGDLEIANGSGQIVALMDANPANSEGRAVFTNAGGEPLAKIGAAGPHGDVLLFGPDKSVPVWEMALTGMMR
jgi:hypothetical protein